MADLPDGPAQRTQVERLRFPGLIGGEVQLLKSWLAAHASEYDDVDGNIRLGDGVDPGPSYPDSTRRAAVMNSQKRVDAAARKGDAWTVIEVKHRVTSSAVGQILTYKALWERQFPERGAPRLLLVCARYDADMLAVLVHHGIELAVVAPAPV